MPKIEKMALFLKQLLENENISEKDSLITNIKNQINNKINLIPIIMKHTEKKIKNKQ